MRSRRRFLRAAGGLAVTGLLAGCTANEPSGTPGRDGGDGTQSVEEWLADTDNYDSVADRTETNAITVEVGPERNEMAFAPAAVRIRPGTTVAWEWPGSGSHNVVAEGGLFTSGDPETGASFEYTFGTSGTTLYYCDPHRLAGMKGAVVVEESGDTGATRSETGE